MAHELPPCSGGQLLAAAFPGTTMIPGTGSRDPKSKACANPGLVFDRYLRIWYRTRTGLSLSPEFSDPSRKKDPGRREDLQAFCDEYEGKACEKEGKGLIATTHRRLDALLGEGDRALGEARSYKTRWRVVTGLGADHPLENGFVFDRSSGVPYFPGTSVKGLCRAAAVKVLGCETGELGQLFGVAPEDGRKTEGTSAGSLVFLPAYPAKDHWPTLEVDVVNNHYPTYYRNLERDPPTGVSRGPRETDSPVPVFFLTVSANTPFTFRICRRHPGVTRAALERGFECLEAGLDYLGLGAKTAAGYGTFERA